MPIQCFNYFIKYKTRWFISCKKNFLIFFSNWDSMTIGCRDNHTLLLKRIDNFARYVSVSNGNDFFFYILISVNDVFWSSRRKAIDWHVWVSFGFFEIYRCYVFLKRLQSSDHFKKKGKILQQITAKLKIDSINCYESP